jgi:hypothetical protein
MGLESAPNSLVHREAMNADVSCNKMRRCLLDVMIYVWLLAEELNLSHASDCFTALFSPSFKG